MNRRNLLEMAGLGGLTALASCTGLPIGGDNGPSGPSTQFAGDFDANLYRAVAAEPGNQFVSPFSVACAFALLYPGARGQTAAEIAAAFGFDPSPDAVATQLRDIKQKLAPQADGSEFTTANAAWVERTMALRAEYARMIKDDLGADIEAVDFVADQPAALKRINDWASRETRGRIPQIISTPDPSRRLVLTNAVYFKGDWTDPFSADSTRDGDFFPASGPAEKARLMRQETHARYFDGGSFQALELDYDNGEFGLAVFLPRDRNGLAAFESNITGGRLDSWLKRLADAEPTRLDVTLPKVKLNADYKLNNQLMSLGVRAAFTPAADLSGVTEQDRLAVSAVIHKTFLEIDEKGTEAAAVTAVDIVVTSARIPPTEPPIEFKADHPFFIVLRHKRSGARLFLGRIETLKPTP